MESVRLAHYAVSGRPIGDAVAESGDRGDELMAEHHRRVRRVPVGPDVKVGAADSGVPDGQQHPARLWNRLGHVADFQVADPGPGLDQRLHRPTSISTLTCDP